VIKINLIPREILATRRDERRWKWVWLAGGLIAAVIALFWAAVFLQVATATSDVASIQQEAAALQAQTSRFDVFQRKEADLRVRQDAVDSAVAGRIDWSQMLFELGLVLPRDVYLTTFTGTDNSSGGAAGDSVVTLAGVALYNPDKAPALGYKSIAKMLVRLADMDQLEAVWLTNATLGVGTDALAPTYAWAVNARITPSSAQTASVGP
jgi:Tfp pilus assembly protein PilN